MTRRALPVRARTSGQPITGYERVERPDRYVRILAAAYLLPTVVLADAIDTNRPGFSFTPGIVERGRAQFETGVTYVRDDADKNTLVLPQAEVRFGIAPATEAFVSSLGWARSEGADATARGLVDPAVGVKFRATDAASATQLALLVQLSVPAGDRAFTSDAWDPAVAAVWTHTGRITLAGTARLSRSGDDYRFDNGLKLPVALGGGHSVFVEWEANLPENGDSAHWLNGGYQLLRGERVQFDLNVGAGLNDAAGDYRAGLGFSFRL